ncbi:MAG: acyl-CoA thioesterase [Phycisphaera sp.]|nr:acyl-CoA thioesterase [Phycisphaera sp.]
MGYAHHSVYPVWFEIARTELLRQTGVSYADLERDGMLIVVVKLELKYRRPARYDDEVRVIATTTRASGVRIEHDYEVRRGHELLCTGSTTLACLDREGKLQQVPEMLRLEK